MLARAAHSVPILLLAAGCTTHSLWTKSVCAPVCPAQLQLFEYERPPDVLVCYREEDLASGRVKPRAYLLFANTNNIVNYHKPEFLRADIEGLRQIPIFDLTQPGSRVPPATGWFATLTPTNRLEYTLHYAGGRIGSYRLPGYENMSGVVRRIALTPITLGADAVIGMGMGMAGAQ